MQRGAEAVYTEAGQKQIQKTLGIYRKNALAILAGVKEVGLRASGGINSPYIWVSVPDGMSSWDFFTSFFGKRRLYVRRDQDSVHAGKGMSV